jgi:hypothetical protein
MFAIADDREGTLWLIRLPGVRLRASSVTSSIEVILPKQSGWYERSAPISNAKTARRVAKAPRTKGARDPPDPPEIGGHAQRFFEPSMTPHETETGMSFIITKAQKDELRRRGYSEEQIREMKPEDAHRALGLVSWCWEADPSLQKDETRLLALIRGLHYREGDAQECSGYAAASYSMEISLPV